MLSCARIPSSTVVQMELSVTVVNAALDPQDTIPPASGTGYSNLEVQVVTSDVDLSQTGSTNTMGTLPIWPRFEEEEEEKLLSGGVIYRGVFQ